jgi:hypothetical protein
MTQEKLAVGEYLDEAGAALLAANIEAFWRQRGKAVATFLVRKTGPRNGAERAPYVVVRSNMVNGMPRA